MKRTRKQPPVVINNNLAPQGFEPVEFTVRKEAPWKGEKIADGKIATKPDHRSVMPNKGQSEKPRRAALGLGPTRDEITHEQIDASRAEQGLPSLYEAMQDPDAEIVPPRAAVLREAEGLITGDRNKSYGSPTENFTNIADLWNVQFRHKLQDGQRFTPTDVATAMIHVKQARLIAQPKRDNFVDIAGYAGCGWEAESDTQADIAAYEAHIASAMEVGNE
jgi:hypothetical protein